MSILINSGSPAAGGFLHPKASLADTDLLDLLAWYKRVVASSYRIAREDDLTAIPSGELHVSPKVDGQLWYLVKTGGEVLLVAHNGRVLSGKVPLLAEARKTFGARAAEGCVLAGELFALAKGRRPRVGDVAQQLANSPDGKTLGWMAFDLVRPNTEERAPQDYAERLAQVQALLDGGKRCKAVKTEVVADRQGVATMYEALVASGKAEGLVVRVGDGRIFKVKPAIDLDCLVLGFTEDVGDEGIPHARSLLLGLVRPDGTTQVVGSVAAHMTFDEKVALLERLTPLRVDSSFRRASSSGALYQFIKPALAVEVRCSDLQSDDSRGQEVRQWALRFTGDAWEPVVPVSGAAILHPILTRLRDDKNIDDVDLRVAQINERVFVTGLNEAAKAVELPKSEVVRREVWTKASKGKQTVRKLLVWKTNKQDIDADFPAWVVHFTDYSPVRKDPLKRTVRLAPDEASATAIADELVAANIKRGWKPA